MLHIQRSTLLNPDLFRRTPDELIAQGIFDFAPETYVAVFIRVMEDEPGDECSVISIMRRRRPEDGGFGCHEKRLFKRPIEWIWEDRIFPDSLVKENGLCPGDSFFLHIGPKSGKMAFAIDLRLWQRRH